MVGFLGVDICFNVLDLWISEMTASHARHLPSLPPWKVEVPESERSNSNMSNVTNGSNESNGTEEVVWHGNSWKF